MYKSVKKLAIVDDDEIFVYLTKKVIAKTDRVERIEAFNNGQDALTFLRDNRDNAQALPEIILLDLAMPIMDGWQFLEEFVKLKPFIAKTITIYICSSSISPNELGRAKSINEVAGFIIKPFTNDRLIGIMEDL